MIQGIRTRKMDKSETEEVIFLSENETILRRRPLCLKQREEIRRCILYAYIMMHIIWLKSFGIELFYNAFC